MKKGLFISLEGPDGSGKSTQLQLLNAFLNKEGYDVVVTREPGGTPIGEKIRGILLDKDHAEMSGATEMFLYAASRAQHVSEMIKPALDQGKIVICDRFIDSSIAYQGFGRKLGEPVKIINEFAVNRCMPDITFLLKLSPEAGAFRIKTKNKDRLECELTDFYKEVSKGYDELEKMYPGRVVGIDAAESIEGVHSIIRSRVETVLKGNYDIRRYK